MFYTNEELIEIGRKEVERMNKRQKVEVETLYYCKECCEVPSEIVLEYGTYSGLSWNGKEFSFNERATGIIPMAYCGICINRDLKTLLITQQKS